MIDREEAGHKMIDRGEAGHKMIDRGGAGYKMIDRGGAGHDNRRKGKEQYNHHVVIVLNFLVLISCNQTTPLSVCYDVDDLYMLSRCLL
jgi:hypothetical protein